MQKSLNVVAGPPRTLSVRIVIFIAPIALILLIIVSMCYARNSPEKLKTEKILYTINIGLTLCYANSKELPITSKAEALFESFSDKRISGPTIADDLRSLGAYSAGDEQFIDGWQRPISISKDHKNGLLLLSSGEDGINGSKDDIIQLWKRDNNVQSD